MKAPHVSIPHLQHAIQALEGGKAEEAQRHIGRAFKLTQRPKEPPMANDHFIQKAIKHPGALHKDLGVPEGQTIPADKLAAAANKGGKVGQRARFAETLKGINRSHNAKSDHDGDEGGY